MAMMNGVSSQQNKSLYQVLGVEETCSDEAIRHAYRRAVLELHPDKLKLEACQDKSNDEFLAVQAAYETLRHADSRAQYDEELRRQQAKENNNVRIADEVLLSEMQRCQELDEETNELEMVFSYSCRCGDVYEISQQELDDDIDVVPCNGCSLYIKVLQQ